MRWNERISFVLTESLIVRRVEAHDQLKGESDVSSRSDDERFDSDFVLMATDLNALMRSLLTGLGGEVT